MGGHERRHLQVGRRRHDVEAADERTAGRRAGEPGDLAGESQAAVRRRRRPTTRPAPAADRGAAGIFRSDDAGETWTRITTDTRPAGRIGGGDLPMPIAAPEGSRRPHHGEHRVVEVDRRRQDVDVVQGRARRRGLSERLDQSRQPRHHPARRRSGRGRHAERRRNLELLVQPADRPVLPRGGRQRVSLSRLQRSAGERIGLRVEPRQLRRDLGSRLGSRRRRRIRLRRPRSAQPRHRLRRPHRDAIRSPDRAGVGRRPGRRPRRRRWSQPGPSVRCARCRSSSRKSTSVRCSSPTTISGRPSTAARTGSS